MFKKLVFIAVGCMFLTSCLEINDETVIDENGSGTLSQSLDMSQLVDIMQAMGGEEFDKYKDEKIDSVIYLKDVVDTVKGLTAEQRELMRRGRVGVKMNMGAKEFVIKAHYPFDNLASLQRLTSFFSSAGTGLGNIMKKLGPGSDGEAHSDQSSPDIDILLQVFDYKISNGSIARTVNQDKLKRLLDNPKLTEIKSGADMGIEVKYNVVYKLPRPVKKVDNAKAELSANKKTVTIQTNLLEIFKNPEQFAFTIEY